MERAIGRKKQIARKLHGERGCALNSSARFEVAISGASDPPKVDTPMAEEVFILGRNQPFAEDLGEIVVGGDHATLQREGTDDAALNVINFGGGDGTEVLKLFDLRQISGIDQ